jgi:hypothetical protein
MALVLLALRFNLGRTFAPHAAAAGQWAVAEGDRRRVPPRRLGSSARYFIRSSTVGSGLSARR